MKTVREYFRKYGTKVIIIVLAAAMLIGFSSLARKDDIGIFHNAFGILKAPVQKAVSSAVNWMDNIYGYLYDYSSLQAENESLRAQLADAQQSARDGIAASEENTRLRQALEV